MTREEIEQPVSNPDINPRLDADLEFKPAGSPPRYNRTTDKPVDFYVTFYADEHPTGLIWFCDEDEAAGYEWWRQLPNENAAIFWTEKLWRAKARGLTPSQAVRELLTEPGTRLSGRILPDSHSVAPSLTWLAELAAHGVPVGDPARPSGWRPDPPFDAGQAEASRAAGGWLYHVDEGHDPTGRIPPHAVVGAWQTDARGRALRFWHNPAYQQAAPPRPEEKQIAPVPPLGAGRRPAGRALLDWLADPTAPRTCRVAGAPGSGRTHLLRWLAAACPPGNPRTDRRVHAVLSAAGLTVRSATWLLAAQLGLAAGTPGELLAALQDGMPRTVVVTDLDLAGDGLPRDAPERIAADLLAPLARIPWLRLLVECASGTSAAAALHAADSRAAVLDLDDPRWTDRARFNAWCEDLGGAAVDTGRVYPSAGLAHLAARTPAGRTGDPLEAWWNALPGDERAAVHALAEAGRPVSLATWAALPGAGGAGTVHRAAARLVPPADNANTLWRAPRELARHIAAVHPPTDHAALARTTAAAVPLLGDGRPDLAQADPALLGIVLRHTVLAGLADRFLTDPALLVHTDPAAITAAFEYTQAHAGTEDPAHTVFAEAWNLAGPVCVTAPTTAERAAALHTHLAGRHRPAADVLAALSGRQRRARWSYRPAAGRIGHLARGNGPYAGHLAYSEHLPDATTGTLRFIDPHTGTPSPGPDPQRLPDGHHAVLLVGDDGSPVLLGRDGSVTAGTAVPPGGTSGSRLAEVFDGITRRTSDALTAAAVAEGADGQVLAIGDDNGHLSYIRTEGGLLTSRRPHQGPVTAVGLTPTRAGLLQISGGADGTVWHWHHGGPEPVCIDARPRPVLAVAAAETPTGLLTATAWADGLVRLRHPGTAGPTDFQLGRPVVGLTAGPDGQVCVALPDAVVALGPA
ncbi:hypothetical protein ACIGZJ_17295 [Kitasatospora sp. NPDC052868]|uniref:hypothetical protein n=1 Tax=Kitasatospora sp. NPDC052868 TaxID=3364060 RepID=UPI0037C60B9C